MRQRYATKPERIMRQILDELKVKYVEQFPIRSQHGFIVDFVIPSEKLAIECDGVHWHKNRQGYDKWRQKKIERLGWKFIRFTDIELEADKNRCKKAILTIVSGPVGCGKLW